MPRDSAIGFGSVRGHERVCAFVRAAVAEDRLPHTVMFTGSEGVGKHTLAVAVAAWLLCEAAGDDACGRCAACHQVNACSHPDFQMVAVPAGKKEIGVDRARDVKRFTQLRPVRGRLKVAVIDDAHMLTIAAQNALLKTLEEPPDHSLLILIANNPDALLPTVRSRCQRVPFAPLPAEVVADILVERHGIEPSAARRLAGLAEGSPGRALALSALAGEAGAEPFLSRLAALDSAGYGQLMKLAQQLGSAEAQVGMKLEILLSQLRDEMVRTITSPQFAPVGAAVSGRNALPTMLRAADLVHQARTAIRRGAPNRQLLLEALVLRLADAR